MELPRPDLGSMGGGTCESKHCLDGDGFADPTVTSRANLAGRRCAQTIAARWKGTGVLTTTRACQVGGETQPVGAANGRARAVLVRKHGVAAQLATIAKELIRGCTPQVATPSGGRGGGGVDGDRAAQDSPGLRPPTHGKHAVRRGKRGRTRPLARARQIEAHERIPDRRSCGERSLGAILSVEAAETRAQVRMCDGCELILLRA